MNDLDLVVAARPFLRPAQGGAGELRQRLRAALYAHIRQRGGIPPSCLIATTGEALDALERLLKRCEELKVPWNEIVCRVNREFIFSGKD